MKSQRIDFEGALGHPLAARLDLPDSAQPGACALFAHCFTCSKDLKAVARLSRALTDRGWGVLRFDFTGLGESAGEFAETNFSSNREDLLAAARYLEAEHGPPELLVGHSLGGAAVLSVAGQVESCRAVVTLGAPSTTEHIRETLLRSAPELDDGSAEEVEVRLAGRKFRIQRQLIEDLESHAVLDAVAELGRPLLVLHSPVDATVGIDHARRIYEAAKHPKSFVSLDRADHLLLGDPEDARYAAEMIASWASRYLDFDRGDLGEGGGRGDAAAVGAGSDHGEVLPQGEVRVRGGRSLRQEILAGRHGLVADEPEDLGGGDAGPTPYELLLAALGSCTNMTLRMYAERKGWPLEGVETHLSHRKIHARDCEDCETETGKIDEIERRIELRGELDDAQLGRLMEIADRCPVHRTLRSEVKIRSDRR